MKPIKKKADNANSFTETTSTPKILNKSTSGKMFEPKES